MSADVLLRSTLKQMPLHITTAESSRNLLEFTSVDCLLNLFSLSLCWTLFRTGHQLWETDKTRLSAGILIDIRLCYKKHRHRWMTAEIKHLSARVCSCRRVGIHTAIDLKMNVDGDRWIWLLDDTIVHILTHWYSSCCSGQDAKGVCGRKAEQA